MYLEFSGEAILSFLELVQFKNYVMGEIEKRDDLNISGAGDRFDFELYDGMPRSSIVYDDCPLDGGKTPVSHDTVASSSGDMGSITSPTENTLVKCKRIARLFFRKYIDYQSVHEINISALMRNKYVKLEQQEYDGMDLEQFVTLYDDVISEMMKYQADSYKRFERAKMEIEVSSLR